MDPDNRRPVDFELRRRLLARVIGISQDAKQQEICAMRTAWQDGAIKLFVTNTLLDFRKSNSELFEKGTYEPCQASGIAVGEVAAFIRWSGESELLTIVSKDARLSSASFERIRLTLNKTRSKAESETGSGTRNGEGWVDLFTGRLIEEEDGTLPLREVFSELPLAVLFPQASKITNR